MACDIVATPGASNATAYTDITYADAYFALGAHLFGATWLAADDDSKCAALKMATQLLDQWYEWCGWPAASTQVLQWPRSGVIDRIGNAQSPVAVPDDIKRGTCELAQALLAGDRRADSEIEVNKITSLSVGAISLGFGAGITPKVIPDAVAATLAAWGELRAIAGTRTLRLKRA